MKRAILCLLAFTAGCAELDPAVLYRCEAQNECLQAGFSCWSDGYCRPTAEPADSGSGGGGGTTGGGGGVTGGGSGGGGGGPMDGGGTDAGDPDAGATDGGETDAGVPDAGNGCTPCPAQFCGYFDAGCGEVFCGSCTDGAECGVARANRCDTPRLCMNDGWCFENPLPQGNTIRGAWVAGPREVYFVGDNGTVLLWNGERHVVVALPPLADGVDFYGVHGTSPQDFFVVGSRGTILHFDGTAWTQEVILGGSNAELRAVLSRPGQPAVVVGHPYTVYRRLPDGTWTDDGVTFNVAMNGLGEGEDGRLYAIGSHAALSRAYLMREGDAGGASVTWSHTAVPLITGNSAWVSPDGGFFIAGLADAGAGQPREGRILRRRADAGWEQIAAVPDELFVVRGLSDGELFAAGNNGLFVHVIDGGARLARVGSRWNALAVHPQGPVVEGRSGQVARYFPADGGFTLLSGGTTLDVNAMCGELSTNLYAGSQGTPGCTGSLCMPLSLERSTSSGGPRWNAVPRTLPDTSEFVACSHFSGLRMMVGDDTSYLLWPGNFWSWNNPAPSGGLPRTRSTSVWFETGTRAWITNGTQPPPGELPFVTRLTGSPSGPTVRGVSYDGGGDLIRVMGGNAGQGWALGQRGLAFSVLPDGGLQPAARLGSEDFNAIDQADLRDGGSLTIAAGLNGALYREEGGPGFVAEPRPGTDFFATWVGETGDAYAVGADVSDGGRRHSRVFRRVDAGWVGVPFAGNQPLRTVWSGALPDGGQAVWVGAPGGLILRRP